MKTQVLCRAVAKALLIGIAVSALAGCSHNTAAETAKAQANFDAGKAFAQQRSEWMKAHPGQEHP